MIKSFAETVLYAFGGHRAVNWQSVSNVCTCRALGFKKNQQSGIDDDSAAAKPYRPKTARQPKITLLGPDKNVSVVTLEVANKMCERRAMKLVKIIDLDTKTQRPVYRMMTANQFLREDAVGESCRDEKNVTADKPKSEKTALISSRIGRSDLESKVNNFRKWLDKLYEVRVTVTGDTANDIANEIIKMTRDYSRVVQRREKGDSVKFQLLPPKTT